MFERRRLTQIGGLREHSAAATVAAVVTACWAAALSGPTALSSPPRHPQLCRYALIMSMLKIRFMFLCSGFNVVLYYFSLITSKTRYSVSIAVQISIYNFLDMNHIYSNVYIQGGGVWVYCSLIASQTRRARLHPGTCTHQAAPPSTARRHSKASQPAFVSGYNQQMGRSMLYHQKSQMLLLICVGINRSHSVSTYRYQLIAGDFMEFPNNFTTFLHFSKYQRHSHQIRLTVTTGTIILEGIQINI